MLNRLIGVAVIIFILSTSFILYAEEEKKPEGMPPAPVVVAEVQTGKFAPQAEFVGTVYYKELSDVAAELGGIVDEVRYEEGVRIKKGDVLVKLNSDLLEKTIQATKASYEEALSDLKSSEINLNRMDKLIKEELISQQSYDDQSYRVKSRQKRAASLQAELDRKETELKKMTIRVPYDAVVIKKHAERGEWLSPGSTVTTLARDDIIIIVVQVPETIFSFLKDGMIVDFAAGGKTHQGKIYALIPRGDISTRTFPVKIAAHNSAALTEGMEARVTLPAGEKTNAFSVPRDAVINVYGNNVVYTVSDGVVKMNPVQVIAYQGMTAGVQAEGMKAEMKVVVKGNERLRDGQTVMVQQ
jgi:RND family efflux transporter MFP subunit